MPLLDRIHGESGSEEEPTKKTGGLSDRLGGSTTARRQAPRPSSDSGGGEAHGKGELSRVGAAQLAEVRGRVQQRMLAEMDPSLNMDSHPELREMMDSLFNSILSEENIVLSRTERQRLLTQVVDEILGFGPLETLLADDVTTDILVVGHDRIYIEREGIVSRTNVTFEDAGHLRRVIDRILAPLGRRIDESSPMVDARLPDGSRVHVIIPPIALDGTMLTIRKFPADPLTVEDLVANDTASHEVFEFMRACVRVGLNIMVSGGSSSGKTTLLNVLSGYIPTDERVVTIEDSAELQLRQPHVVRMESRPPNIEGEGEVTIRDLVVNSLRMRPDRIVVGEVRSEEALDLLQAMNTGHEGSLSTVHSNSAKDSLTRIETMCLMAGMDLPVRAIREQVASAIHMVVHMSRMTDGSRKIVQVTEVLDMEGDVIMLSDIFDWHQTGIESGRIQGQLRPTGIRPRAMKRIIDGGIHLPEALFGAGTATVG